MTVQNMKYSIFFSFLFFIGMCKAAMPKKTDTDKPSFIPLLIFPSLSPVTSARYAPITFTVGWTSRPAEP